MLDIKGLQWSGLYTYSFILGLVGASVAQLANSFS